MSAALPREAAALMRERAESATPGPWRVGAEGSEGSRVNPMTGERREDSRHIASVNGRVQPQDGQNAAYIASWHPAVALAVADWLDKATCSLHCNANGMRDPYCWRCEDSGCDHECPSAVPCTHSNDFKAALAVARAYLGRDA